MSTEHYLKFVRICGVLSIIVFAFSLLSAPAVSSAMVDRMREWPADEWYNLALEDFSEFVWIFGGIQAGLAALSIVFSCIAISRQGGTPGASSDGRGSL